jgi:hypothetical protein
VRAGSTFHSKHEIAGPEPSVARNQSQRVSDNRTSISKQMVQRRSAGKLSEQDGALPRIFPLTHKRAFDKAFGERSSKCGTWHKLRSPRRWNPVQPGKCQYSGSGQDTRAVRGSAASLPRRGHGRRSSHQPRADEWACAAARPGANSHNELFPGRHYARDNGKLRLLQAVGGNAQNRQFPDRQCHLG